MLTPMPSAKKFRSTRYRSRWLESWTQWELIRTVKTETWMSTCQSRQHNVALLIQTLSAMASSWSEMRTPWSRMRTRLPAFCAVVSRSRKENLTLFAYIPRSLLAKRPSKRSECWVFTSWWPRRLCCSLLRSSYQASCSLSCVSVSRKSACGRLWVRPGARLLHSFSVSRPWSR